MVPPPHQRTMISVMQNVVVKRGVGVAKWRVSDLFLTKNGERIYFLSPPLAEKRKKKGEMVILSYRTSQTTL